LRLHIFYDILEHTGGDEAGALIRHSAPEEPIVNIVKNVVII